MGNGERIPLLVEGSPLGRAVPSVTRFVLTALRPRGLKANTLRARVSALGLGLSFCEAREIDITVRLAKSQFLDYEELAAFADCCCRRSDGSNRPINPQFACTRFKTFADFLLWSSGPIIARINDDQLRILANSARELFKSQVQALAPYSGGSSRWVEGERLGLTPDQRDLLVKIITPGSDLNPFSEDLQFRNYAIFMLAREWGTRGGELLALKTRQIDFSTEPATLKIIRSHHDQEDPRRDQPVQKTNGRVLDLSSSLRDILRDWIVKHRADRKRFRNARKHPFLFVNKFGDPLSLRGLRRLPETIRRSFPDLAPLCAHILRHDWNDRLTERAAAEGWDLEEMARYQKYAMGWSQNSTMPERYSRRSIGKLANERILALQERDLLKHE